MDRNTDRKQPRQYRADNLRQIHVLSRQKDIVLRQAHVLSRQKDIPLRQSHILLRQKDIILRQSHVLARQKDILLYDLVLTQQEYISPLRIFFQGVPEGCYGKAQTDFRRLCTSNGATLGNIRRSN